MNCQVGRHERRADLGPPEVDGEDRAVGCMLHDDQF